MAVVIPSSFELIRIFLILPVVASALITLLLLMRRLTRARELRLKSLRKWQVEIFTLGDSVDSLSESQFESLVRLIDSVEDSTKSKVPFYERLENEFTQIIKGVN